MKKILIILILVASNYVFSQTEFDVSGQKLMEDVWYKKVYSQNISEIEGSPYHNKNFRAAKVGGTDEELLARYNILYDNVEFIRDGNIMVVPKEQIYGVFHFVDNNEKLFLKKNSYYFQLFDGINYQLYKKENVKFQKFERAANGYVQDKQAKFISQPSTYYFSSKNKIELIEITKKVKSFASLFPGKSKEIEEFIKNNNFKLNSENDIKRVIKFIDQL